MARPAKTAPSPDAETKQEPEATGEPVARNPAPASGKVPEGHVRVETTGDFGLLDITTGADIDHAGPSTVPDSSFIRARIALGQLRLLA